MTFGKYSGKRLDEIPIGYLRWLLRECDNLEVWLRLAVEAELVRRGEPPPRSGSGAGHYPPPVDVRALLQVWFREMSLRWHPDRGGSDAAMQAVVDGYERLKRLAGVA
jgi:hypothetical protein